MNCTKTVQNGGFNPFSFSVTFENPIRAVGGKTWEISTARDAAIVVTIHTWAHLEVRDELFIIGE